MKSEELAIKALTKHLDPSTGTMTFPIRKGAVVASESIECADLLSHPLTSLRVHGKILWANKHRTILETRFKADQELTEPEISELLLILKAVHFRVEGPMIEKRFALACKYGGRVFGEIMKVFTELGEL